MNRQYLPYNQKSTYYIPTNPQQSATPSRNHLSPQPYHQSNSDHFIPTTNIRPSHDDAYQEKGHQITNTSNLINYQSPQMTKDHSQKRLPIIYSTYNENHQKPPVKIQTKILNPLNSNVYSYKDEPQHQIYKQNSNHNFYMQSHNKVDSSQRIAFDTFQHIPTEKDISTAKFINVQPANNHDQYQYKSIDVKPQYVNNNNQQQLHYNNNNHLVFSHNILNHHQPHQTIISNSYDFPLGVNSSHKKYEQPPPKIQNPIYSSQLIQISKQEYQSLHLYKSQLHKKQFQKNQLKLKCDQLSKSKIFYHQQNNNLRHQIQRLHNIISNTQIKTKQLLNQNNQLKNNINNLIPKYRQSILEQIGLLVERYRLQQKRNH